MKSASQQTHDARFVCLVNERFLTEIAFALAVLLCKNMALESLLALNAPGGGALLVFILGMGTRMSGSCLVIEAHRQRK